MTKNDGHKFFRKLINKYPDDASLMLIDIITDYFMFPLNEDKNKYLLDEIKVGVAAIYTGTTASKIKAIKFVKDKVNWSLKEAKDYVENGIIPNWSYGSERMKILNQIFEKISKDYRID